MSDIKLFRVNNLDAHELQGSSVAIERSLQTLMEAHLDALLAVRFLASEYSTGKIHGGRIDTLGIDENGSPVIIEYKRALNENVINQGLYYLDWLMDHRAEFELLVLKRLGQGDAGAIDWASPRLLCIAADFTRYDEHAVQQINRNIDLIRYRRYGDDLLLLELVNATLAQAPAERLPMTETLDQAPVDLRNRYEALKAFLLALGDDVQLRGLKYYIAFKRIKNFACVELHPQARKMLVYVKVDPDAIPLSAGFTRDVRSIGHFGTGELEITVASDDDLERAKSLLIRSYEAS